MPVCVLRNTFPGLQKGCTATGAPNPKKYRKKGLGKRKAGGRAYVLVPSRKRARTA